MAKKPLKVPDLPSGKRLDFFLFMQDLVLRNGDWAVARIAQETDLSHQAVYKALTGPRMPSRHVAMTIAKTIADDSAEKAAELHWTEGVAEQRALAGRQPRPRRSSIAESPEPKTAVEMLASAVKDAAAESGKSIGQIAKETDLPRSTAYAAVSGKSLPSESTWRILSRALGLQRLEKLYANAIDEAGMSGRLKTRNDLRSKQRKWFDEAVQTTQDAYTEWQDLVKRSEEADAAVEAARQQLKDARQTYGHLIDAPDRRQDQIDTSADALREARRAFDQARTDRHEIEGRRIEAEERYSKASLTQSGVADNLGIINLPW
ncbi:helix-turn-helix transcriptional regulator [Nocardia asiatica]|uniref:helix-turn-helix transcriptional regulator n=1 Tax=Nocardia asiatica TaxID=209252 RepID=UPI0024582D6F|nr:helix-turn-helix transcriptional regulator [Nocardia asiatica]